MMVILAIICATAFIIFKFYYYHILTYDFWKKRGIPGPDPIPFFGTTKNITLGRQTRMKYIKEIYNRYKHEPFIGVFFQSTPVLIVTDPRMMKDILITHSAVFSGRGYSSNKAHLLTQTIFFAAGDTPLRLRTKLSPTFSPAKVKKMFLLVLESMEYFKNWLDTILLENDMVNCSEAIARFTIDLSIACILNYDIKCVQDRDKEFLYNSRSILEANTSRQYNSSLWYNLINYLLGRDKAESFIMNFIADIMKYKKQHGVIKDDIASILTKMRQEREKLSDEVEATDELIAANVALFIFASFDTSAATITNTLYELALNQTIQDRLREEILDEYARKNGEVEYDDVNVMSYLNRVFKETLRKYPPVDSIQRRASTSYTFRNSQLVIPKNQLVVIPIYAFHHDPMIYPNPEVYDPERFIGDAGRLKEPMYYLPFGQGPRNCIGERFGTLQAKAGIITVVRNYKIDVCEKTQIPYVYGPDQFIQQSENIHLKLTKIN